MFKGLYPGVARGNSAHNQRKPPRISKQTRNGSSMNVPGSKENTLALRLKALLEKYKDDKETRDKILGKVEIYRINLTIAQECKDKETMKELNRELNQFLNQF